MQKNYLTEEKLKNYYLPKLFEGVEFVHNKIVPNSDLKSRPDFRSEKLKLIIEFDGYLHYSKSSAIYQDGIKDFTYKEMGYTIIRIPYFLQISKLTIKYWFNLDCDIEQKYSHGFIDNLALLPSDFCALGIKRFKEELKELPDCIMEDISNSLIEKWQEKRYAKLVVPESLYYLLKIV